MKRFLAATASVLRRIDRLVTEHTLAVPLVVAAVALTLMVLL